MRVALVQHDFMRIDSYNLRVSLKSLRPQEQCVDNENENELDMKESFLRTIVMVTWGFLVSIRLIF